MRTTKLKNWMWVALCGTSLLGVGQAQAQGQGPAEVGRPAPTFTAKDATGKPVSLADFKGKFVVLEWTNPECPFVMKHYNGGNMPATQKDALAKGAVWLSIQTNPQDASGAALQAWQKSKGAAPTASVVDPDGKIARSYRAATTPHMYIVDPKGTLVYAGAIDSKPSVDAADIKTATNFVTQALGEVTAGKAVSRPNTVAYGCTVKYPA
jgi:hypothetical protein